ncbi:TonB-dependent receptor [Henriciella sp.]|uniref:TonB-dependent receptor family protein n=1 Tax=Henriciella sp. TaxID=1968823 RepID=UPI00342AFE78
MKTSFIRVARTAALTAPVALLSHVASAQGVGQLSDRLELDVVTVEGKKQNGTAIDSAAAKAALERIPGAVGLVESDVFLDDFTQSIGDALIYTPGVFADTSATRESRLSIRGSGLSSTFERRGLTVLRDGVPISRASGSTEFQEIDPLTIDYIEVFKGANGLQYGASSLGGAINIVTPTGRTRGDAGTVRLEGGSFDTLRASASLSRAGDKWDFYTGLTGLKSEGFRDHSAVESLYSHSNFGYSFDNGVDTRFYLTALSDNFELSGSLSFDEVLSNPTSLPPATTIGPFFPGGPVTVLDAGPAGDDWDRNLDVYRLANKTVIPLDGFDLELGAWYAYRELDHAITRFAGIIAQEEDEFGASARLDGDTQMAGLNVGWVLGTQISTSENDARTFANNFGERGALTSRNDQSARNIITYGQLDLGVTESVTAIVGFQHIDSMRETENVFQGKDGKVTKSQFSPKFGLLWDVDPDAQVFFNINKSYEPASISDLTAGGVLPFTPLDAQKAWTVELGSRGQKGRFAWDVAVYRSEIENEFVELAYPGTRGDLSDLQCRGYYPSGP